MASAVFFAAIGCHKFVVLSFDFGIRDRVLLLKVGEQLTNQQTLTCQFELRFVVFAGIQAAFASFLHENFTGNQFFFDLRQNFGGDGAT